MISLCCILYTVYLWTCLTCCLFAIFSLRFMKNELYCTDCVPYASRKTAGPLWQSNAKFSVLFSVDHSLASQSQSKHPTPLQIKSELVRFTLASLRLNVVKEMFITCAFTTQGTLCRTVFTLSRSKSFICNPLVVLYVEPLDTVNFTVMELEACSRGRGGVSVALFWCVCFCAVPFQRRYKDNGLLYKINVILSSSVWSSFSFFSNTFKYLIPGW